MNFKNRFKFQTNLPATVSNPNSKQTLIFKRRRVTIVYKQAHIAMFAHVPLLLVAALALVGAGVNAVVMSTQEIDLQSVGPEPTHWMRPSKKPTFAKPTKAPKPKCTKRPTAEPSVEPSARPSKSPSRPSKKPTSTKTPVNSWGNEWGK